jgi:hypothetical protein
MNLQPPPGCKQPSLATVLSGAETMVVVSMLKPSCNVAVRSGIVFLPELQESCLFGAINGLLKAPEVAQVRLSHLNWPISHRHMNQMSLVREQVLGKRRSQRVKVPMQIGVASAEAAAKEKPFRATATNLNRYGALVCSEREVRVGSHVLLINPKNEKALARVVVEAHRRESLRQYGVEFMDSRAGETFWGLTFVKQEIT